MNKKKIQFTDMLLLLTLNGINIFGMNRETINETQKKMSIETKDFLDKIYGNFIEIRKAFYNLYRQYRMLCEITSKDESLSVLVQQFGNIDHKCINDVFHILTTKEKQIKNKEQFGNKNPAEILMTDITIEMYKKEYNFNVFLEEKLFYMIIAATNYMFNYIINDDFFKKEWINKKKDKCIQDYAVEVFENISQYLTTMERFINGSLKDKKLKEELLTRVEDLKKNNQEELEEIKKIKTQEDLQKEETINETQKIPTETEKKIF